MAPKRKEVASMPARRSVRINDKPATVAKPVASHKQARKERKKLLRKARRVFEIEAARTVAAGRPLCANCQIVHDAANVRHAAQPSAKKAAKSSPEEGQSSHLPPASHGVANAGTSEAEAPFVLHSVHRGDTAALGERANSRWARFSDELYAWVPVAACVAMVYVHLCADPQARLIGLRG